MTTVSAKSAGASRSPARGSFARIRGCQSRAALRAPALDQRSSGAGLHSRAESVFPGAPPPARLVCPLHRCLPHWEPPATEDGLSGGEVSERATLAGSLPPRQGRQGHESLHDGPDNGSPKRVGSPRVRCRESVLNDASTCTGLTVAFVPPFSPRPDCFPRQSFASPADPLVTNPYAPMPAPFWINFSTCWLFSSWGIRTTLVLSVLALFAGPIPTPSNFQRGEEQR